MTREPWPIPGPRESLPRRAGYRSMRLKVVTDIGGRWARRHARRARWHWDGGRSLQAQADRGHCGCVARPVGVSLGTAKENV